MSTLLIVVAVLGVLISIVGGLMLLVTAFRQGILWGLGYILVPMASLVFVIVYWKESKNGFLISIAGLVVTFAALYNSPEFWQVIDKRKHTPLLELFAAARPEKASSADLTPRIDAARAKLDTLQRQFTEQNRVLSAKYKDLSARRKSLKEKDLVAVQGYNAEAADYARGNAALKQIQTDLQATQVTLDQLLAERSKAQASKK